jgi:hypothetical protein
MKDEIMKVAVLIDAENISFKYAKMILDEASRLGTVVCRRIYGDWSDQSLSSWKNAIMEYSFNAIQQFHNTKGKNSSDSALIIDAMDLLHGSSYQCMCIVSSDSDFSKLASRMRESEIYVVGMGETKTPVSFRSSCDKFLYLDVLLNKYKEAEIRAQKEAKALGAPKSEEKSGLNKTVIIEEIDTIIDDESAEDGWIMLSDLGSKLSQKFPDFDVRNFGFSKLSGLIKSLKRYELRGESQDGANPTAKVFYVRKKD